MVAAATISCGGNTYSVKGSVSPTDDLKDALAIMQDVVTGQVDTAVVIGGKFAFKGNADTNTVAVVSLSSPSARNRYAMFVPEKGEIVVDLDSVNCVKGGPMTSRLQES